MLHCAVEGEAAAPPAIPADGTAWLVAAAPSGDWSGKAGLIACRQGGNWLYVAPRDGMRLVDRSTGQARTFLGSWQVPAAPAGPSGGAVIDAQARAAITQLIAGLRTAGVFPAT